MLFGGEVARVGEVISDVDRHPYIDFFRIGQPSSISCPGRVRVEVWSRTQPWTMLIRDAKSSSGAPGKYRLAQSAPDATGTSPHYSDVSAIGSNADVWPNILRSCRHHLR